MKKRTTISMKHSLTIAALCVALGATANELNAQDYRYAASYNAGGAWFSPLNSGAGQGTDLKFDLGWIMGLQFEQWLGSGRTGWRLNGAVSERAIDLPGGNRDVGMWFADLDLLLRLMPADQVRRVYATVCLGGGLGRY
jgi:hypothetical protein